MSKGLLQQRAIPVIVKTLVAAKSNAAAGRHNDCTNSVHATATGFFTTSDQLCQYRDRNLGGCFTADIKPDGRV